MNIFCTLNIPLTKHPVGNCSSSLFICWSHLHSCMNIFCTLNISLTKHPVGICSSGLFICWCHLHSFHYFSQCICLCRQTQWESWECWKPSFPMSCLTLSFKANSFFLLPNLPFLKILNQSPPFLANYVLYLLFLFFTPQIMMSIVVGWSNEVWCLHSWFPFRIPIPEH